MADEEKEKEEDKEQKDKKEKKDKDKDNKDDLAPGEVISPMEYKMFDPSNMQKSLSIPQKPVYAFQRQLSGTLQRRLENIRMKLGSDDSHPVADKNEVAELTAGLQPWEDIDPATGQLLELRSGSISQPAKEALIQEIKTPALTVTQPGAHAEPGAAPGQVKPAGPPPNITPSIVKEMRGALPKAKVEDKNAMPPVNRRTAAPPIKFEGVIKATEPFEYADYYEAIEKQDKYWSSVVGKPMSMSVAKFEKKPEPGKGVSREPLNPTQKRRASLSLQPQTTASKNDRGDMPGGRELSVALNARTVPTLAPPSVLKKTNSKRPAGTPAFLDGVIEYFTQSVSPDCNLSSWLSPIDIQPVFRIKDVPPDVENIIVTIAKVTHSKFIDDQGIAALIRSALEKYHGYACKWHVVVGRKFGMNVNADKGNFLFMYIGHLGYVVFRTFG